MGRRPNGKNILTYLGVKPTTPPQMLVNNRRPTANDYKYDLGTFWMVPGSAAPDNNELWILTHVVGTVATWTQIRGGNAGTTDFQTDVGLATEAANTINIYGGTNINTTGAGQDVTVNLDDSVSLAGTLTVTGNGTFNSDLQVQNDIDTVAGDITAGGAVAAGTNVNASNNVTAVNAITATNGAITATNGNIIAVAGDIDANAGSITANQNLTATTGNIIATAGNVTAGAKVTAGVNLEVTSGYVQIDDLRTTAGSGNSKTVFIDSNNRLCTGGGPGTTHASFSAYLSASQIDATGVQESGLGANPDFCIYDKVWFDPLNMYDTGTGIWTVPITGIWAIHAAITIEGMTSKKPMGLPPWEAALITFAYDDGAKTYWNHGMHIEPTAAGFDRNLCGLTISTLLHLTAGTTAWTFVEAVAPNHADDPVYKRLNYFKDTRTQPSGGSFDTRFYAYLVA